MRKKVSNDEAEAFNPPRHVLEPKTGTAAVGIGEEVDLEDPLQRQAHWARKNQTALERRVGKLLGGKQGAFEFEAQVVFDGVIFDFLSRKHMLAVEADGPDHRSPEARAADEARDKRMLDKHGIRTIRLTYADFARHSRQSLYFLIDEFLKVRHLKTYNGDD